MRIPLLLALLSLYAAGADAAKERPFVDNVEPAMPSSVQEREPWQEQEATLPPWPNDSDLVEFQLDSNPGAFRYFIDGKNLTVGRDGVVRYTLVAESRTGARNVSFEGLRCTPRGEYKVYGYGVGERFSASPTADWQPIPGLASGDYRRELHGYFLCVPRKFEPRPKNDMIRAMRGPINPGQNTGFMTE